MTLKEKVSEEVERSWPPFPSQTPSCPPPQQHAPKLEVSRGNGGPGSHRQIKNRILFWNCASNFKILEVSDGNRHVPFLLKLSRSASESYFRRVCWTEEEQPSEMKQALALVQLSWIADPSPCSWKTIELVTCDNTHVIQTTPIIPGKAQPLMSLNWHHRPWKRILIWAWGQGKDGRWNSLPSPSSDALQSPWTQLRSGVRVS